MSLSQRPVLGSEIISRANLLSSCADKDTIIFNYETIREQSNGFNNIIFDDERGKIYSAIETIQGLALSVQDDSSIQKPKSLFYQITDNFLFKKFFLIGLGGGALKCLIPTLSLPAGCVISVALYFTIKFLANYKKEDQQKSSQISEPVSKIKKSEVKPPKQLPECPISGDIIYPGEEIEIDGQLFDIKSFTKAVLSIESATPNNPMNRQPLTENQINKISLYFKINRDDFINLFDKSENSWINILTQQKIDNDIATIPQNLTEAQQILRVGEVQNNKSDIVRDIRLEAFKELVGRDLSQLL